MTVQPLSPKVAIRLRDYRLRINSERYQQHHDRDGKSAARGNEPQPLLQSGGLLGSSVKMRGY